MGDRFENYRTYDGPATGGASIDPTVDTVLPTPSRMIWIGAGGGAVEVLLLDNDDYIVFDGIQAGTWLPLRVTAIRAAGTTATSIKPVW